MQPLTIKCHDNKLPIQHLLNHQAHRKLIISSERKKYVPHDIALLNHTFSLLAYFTAELHSAYADLGQNVIQRVHECQLRQVFVNFILNETENSCIKKSFSQKFVDYDPFPIATVSYMGTKYKLDGRKSTTVERQDSESSAKCRHLKKCPVKEICGMCSTREKEQKFTKMGRIFQH
jgi:hypothetical protein